MKKRGKKERRDKWRGIWKRTEMLVLNSKSLSERSRNQYKPQILWKPLHPSLVCLIWTSTKVPKTEQLFLKSQKVTEWQEGSSVFLILDMFSSVPAWSDFFSVYSQDKMLHSQYANPSYSFMPWLTTFIFCTLGSWIFASMLVLLQPLFC